MFHDRSLRLRSFIVFVLLVLYYYSAVWCSVADSFLKLRDRVIRSACFIAGGVLESNLSHRRSVSVLCMLFQIKSNPMHPVSGALPLPYVPARITRGALVAHRHSFAPPLCRTSQYPKIFVHLSVSLDGVILMILCFMVWEGRALRAEPIPSCWPNLLFLFVFHNFLFFFLPRIGCVGLGYSE